MKTLELKPNETAEEGFQRKANVLDRLYTLVQLMRDTVSSDVGTKNTLKKIVILFDEFNQISIEEE